MIILSNVWVIVFNNIFVSELRFAFFTLHSTDLFYFVIFTIKISNSMKGKNFFRNFLMFLLLISFLAGVGYTNSNMNGTPFLYLCGAIVIALSITYVKEE